MTEFCLFCKKDLQKDDKLAPRAQQRPLKEEQFTFELDSIVKIYHNVDIYEESNISIDPLSWAVTIGRIVNYFSTIIIIEAWFSLTSDIRSAELFPTDKNRIMVIPTNTLIEVDYFNLNERK